MAKRFYLGVIGSRERCSTEDYKLIENHILSLYDEHERNLIIISGGCKQGGDHFAEDIAHTYGIPILIFYPDKQNPPDTGNSKRDYGIICYERNTEIAKHSKTLIALVSDKDDIKKGGTGDTIKKFKKYHKGQELIIL